MTLEENFTIMPAGYLQIIVLFAFKPFKIQPVMKENFDGNLCFREQGQSSVSETRGRDFRKELDERERNVREKRDRDRDRGKGICNVI